MSWIDWILLAAGAVIVWFTVTYFMGNPGFWKLVAKKPDEAYGLFLLSGCLVDEDPLPNARSKYAGPFRFMTSDGGIHVVYIPADQIIDIQKRVAAAITDG
ncbi:MAG: hypothetical protein WAV72_11740 [Bradyrhizobium sp.]